MTLRQQLVGMQPIRMFVQVAGKNQLSVGLGLLDPARPAWRADFAGFFADHRQPQEIADRLFS